MLPPLDLTDPWDVWEALDQARALVYAVTQKPRGVRFGRRLNKVLADLGVLQSAISAALERPLAATVGSTQKE